MVGLRCCERSLGNHLTNQWGAEASLGKLHHSGEQLLVASDEGTNADAALAVALRYRVDNDGVVLDALEVQSAQVRLVVVTELTIHLVADEVEVVFLHQVAQLQELLVAVECSGGVVGVANHDCAGAVGDKLLKLLNRWQCIAVLNLGGDGAHLHAHLVGKAHIVGIHGFGNDEFVARVEA